MANTDRSKLLGTVPMARLVPKVSIPIMFSMLIVCHVHSLQTMMYS